MYSFFLGGLRLPVAPSKMSLKVSNKNRTIDLMNLGEVNILKAPGLSDISFEFLLPAVQYPFAVYDGGFVAPEQYLASLKKLKKDKKPFRFTVSRISPKGDFLFETNMLVSLESYSIVEDAQNGLDIMVSVELKEYKSYGTQTLKIEASASDSEPAKAVIEEKRPAKEPISQYTVKAGDSLWAICKKQLGDGSKYAEIAKLNGISNPSSIIPGQTIRFS